MRPPEGLPLEVVIRMKIQMEMEMEMEMEATRWAHR